MDLRLMQAIADHRAHALNRFALDVMRVGESRLVLALGVLVGIAIVVWLRAWRAGLAVAVAAVAGSVVAAVAKAIVERGRPPAQLVLVHVGGYSMPSTHAVRTAAPATVIVIAVALAASRWWPAVAAVLAGLLVVSGACMVYLGAHWLSDVLVGWVVGIAVGVGSAWATGLLRTEPRAVSEVLSSAEQRPAS